MERLFIIIMLVCDVFAVRAQSIRGTWQLTELPPCYGNSGLFARVKTAEEGFSYALVFDEGNKGAQGLRKDSSPRLSHSKRIMYRTDGESLFILDPRVQLIEGTYIITTLTRDSLIVVNPRKSCEEFEFWRVE